MSYIIFDRVCKKFENRTILKDLSFKVEPKELFCILGKSGTGKSVTLKHLVRLLEPDSGKILVFNQDLSKLSSTALTLHRQNCALVFQHPALFEHLNVRDNIAFTLHEQNRHKPGVWSQNQIHQKVNKALLQVGLKDKVALQLVSDLSFGMQKRISIARALCLEPKILLLDEPTTGLDHKNAASINDLMKQLAHETGQAVIVVSHDIQSALTYSDKILLLDEGENKFYGNPSEFMKCSYPLAQAFLKTLRPRPQGGAH